MQAGHALTCEALQDRWCRRKQDSLLPFQQLFEPQGANCFQSGLGVGSIVCRDKLDTCSLRPPVLLSRTAWWVLNQSCTSLSHITACAKPGSHHLALIIYTKHVVSGPWLQIGWQQAESCTHNGSFWELRSITMTLQHGTALLMHWSKTTSQV